MGKVNRSRYSKLLVEGGKAFLDFGDDDRGIYPIKENGAETRKGVQMDGSTAMKTKMVKILREGGIRRSIA